MNEETFELSDEEKTKLRKITKPLKGYAEDYSQEPLKEYDLGKSERSLMRTAKLPGMTVKLPFDTEVVPTDNGQTIRLYIIPDDKKNEILQLMWPFDSKINLQDEMVDIHCDQKFKVKDFKVAHFAGLNYLVSPYYAKAGGTVLDWMPVEANDARKRFDELEEFKASKDDAEKAKKALVDKILEDIGDTSEAARMVVNKVLSLSTVGVVYGTREE